MAGRVFGAKRVHELTRRDVAHHMRKNVQRGVVPIDPFSVVPDFLRRLNGHVRSPWIMPRTAVRLKNSEYGTGVRASMRFKPGEAEARHPNWRGERRYGGDLLAGLTALPG